MRDLITELIKRLGPWIILVIIVMGVSVWFITHLIAEPGEKIKIFGIIEYTKGKPPLKQEPLDDEILENVRYRGDALLVIQTETKIIVENIYESLIAIRISWDRNDPHGKGEGEDSFINDSVIPGMRINREFNDHSSVQIWAWDTSSLLIDSFELLLKVKDGTYDKSSRQEQFTTKITVGNSEKMHIIIMVLMLKEKKL